MKTSQLPKQKRANFPSNANFLPSFMMVLVGVGDFPYQRDDGVLVVPIGCLKD